MGCETAKQNKISLFGKNVPLGSLSLVVLTVQMIILMDFWLYVDHAVNVASRSLLYSSSVSGFEDSAESVRYSFWTWLVLGNCNL